MIFDKMYQAYSEESRAKAELANAEAKVQSIKNRLRETEIATKKQFNELCKLLTIVVGHEVVAIESFTQKSGMVGGKYDTAWEIQFTYENPIRYSTSNRFGANSVVSQQGQITLKTENIMYLEKVQAALQSMREEGNLNLR